MEQLVSLILSFGNRPNYSPQTEPDLFLVYDFIGSGWIFFWMTKVLISTDTLYGNDAMCQQIIFMMCWPESMVQASNRLLEIYI